MTPDRDQLADSIDALEAQIESGRSPRAFAPLAEAYRLLGRLEDALRVARQGAASCGDHVAVKVVLARTLVDLKDHDGAREVYREALELDPDNLEARAYLEELPGEKAAGTDDGRRPEQPATAREPGSLSEELEHLADLFVPSSRANHPGHGGAADGIATITLAEIYSRQGLNDKAAEICERILDREPENQEARRLLERFRKHPASI